MEEFFAVLAERGIKVTSRSRRASSPTAPPTL
jgi:hypothetical protein